ncbi:MAG: hypothetical protein WAM79_17700 [Candidatus Sulfotelmatobacter sp.]
MRRTFFLSLVVFFLGSLAVAQIPTSGNVFAGYSYYNTNVNGANRQSVNGWEGSLEGKFFPIPFLGIVADFSANYGNLSFPVACPLAINCSTTSVNSHVDNFLIGPRASVSVGKFRPFAEALIGFGHINTNGFGSDTSVASGVGGGLDYKLISLVAWRFQGDYIHTHLFNLAQNNLRLSTGIVIRF